jgi:hypothetical protein
MKTGTRYVTGDTFTAIKLVQTASDLSMDGVLVFPKQFFFIVEHLDRPFDKFLDALVSAAFDFLLDQLLQFGLQVNGHRGTVSYGAAAANFMIPEIFRLT